MFLLCTRQRGKARLAVCWLKSVCRWVWDSRKGSKETCRGRGEIPPTPCGGYLANSHSWILLIDAVSASLHHRLYPPSTIACWREPCNNPPCFHDNHLLLSSPHLSFPLSPLPPCLHSPLSSSPLSCLPLCTLLVFQGQRGSQADSEIETEIGLAKWGGENYNNGTEDRQRKAGGQKSPRRRYGTLRLQTFALFGLCRLHRLHPQHFHNLIWSQLWAKMADNRLYYGVAAVVASFIFPAAWAENKTREVQWTRTCLRSIKRSTGRATLSSNQLKRSLLVGLKRHTHNKLACSHVAFLFFRLLTSSWCFIRKNPQGGISHRTASGVFFLVSSVSDLLLLPVTAWHTSSTTVSNWDIPAWRHVTIIAVEVRVKQWPC